MDMEQATTELGHMTTRGMMEHDRAQLAKSRKKRAEEEERKLLIAEAWAEASERCYDHIPEALYPFVGIVEQDCPWEAGTLYDFMPPRKIQLGFLCEGYAPITITVKDGGRWLEKPLYTVPMAHLYGWTPPDFELVGVLPLDEAVKLYWDYREAHNTTDPEEAVYVASVRQKVWHDMEPELARMQAKYLAQVSEYETQREIERMEAEAVRKEREKQVDLFAVSEEESPEDRLYRVLVRIANALENRMRI